MAPRKKYSLKRRKAMSAGKQAQALRDFESRGPDPTHKRCSKCKSLKPVTAFYQRKVKRKSGFTHVYAEASCKKCFRAKQKEMREKRKQAGIDDYERWREWWASASPQQKARTRELDREKQAARRRMKGTVARGQRGPRATNAGERLDPKPILDLLARELYAGNEPVNGTSSRGVGVLAERSGVAQRNIYALMHGEYAQVALATVDKLLIGMGLPHMLAILYPEA